MAEDDFMKNPEPCRFVLDNGPAQPAGTSSCASSPRVTSLPNRQTREVEGANHPYTGGHPGRQDPPAFDPSETVEMLIAVPDEDDVAVFRLLPRDLAGRVFAYLPLDHQENLIRCLSREQMRQVLAGMTAAI